MAEETGRAEGLFESLRNLARTFVALVQNPHRDLRERNRRGKDPAGANRGVLAAIAALCIALAVILLVFFLVVLFWDKTDRLLAIGGAGRGLCQSVA